ncbi:JmjC domain-containing protein [Thalassotalea agariperforans]
MYQINWEACAEHITPEIFLKEYWQKKPLFIRGAISNSEGFFVVPIDADELAGLAMEEEIQSRIVGQNAQKQWFVEHGPFDDFSKFGEEYWTLLVQATNHWSTSTQAMLKPFRFIPNWRIDDVMVSFSTPNGGVGPHLDQYDVFIIQGQGKRRWQVGLPDDNLATLIPHCDLKQVSEFTPVIDVVTQAGDLLYIPPNHPHNGVSLENSVNYSVGFQAPSGKELWSGFADMIIDKNLAEQRFGDAERQITKQPERIKAQDFQALKNFMLTTFNHDETFNHFICQHLTQNHHSLDIVVAEEDEFYSVDELDEVFKDAESIVPTNGVKSLYNEVNNTLYVNGECFSLTDINQEFAIALAKSEPLTIKQIKSFKLCLKNKQLLTSLLNNGCWYIE